MKECNILVDENLNFNSYHDALTHISCTLIEKGNVKPTHLEALKEREANYPTGIAFKNYAVAIPHCEAAHAIKPCIYVIRTQKPVAFNRADDDSMADCSLILGLVVVDPKDQIKLLRTLFSQLQDQSFYDFLLSAKNQEIQTYFQNHLSA